MVFFESTLFRTLLRKCCKIKDNFESMDALSDDYYNEISVRFLINEFERTKEERQKFMRYMDNFKHSESFIH